jgi:hypothetical protein
MIPTKRLELVFAVFAACVFSAALAVAQAPKTVVVELSGEVVQVQGNTLVVKLTTGDVATFNVPETRKFEIDGKEVSVHELQPGTTLTATVTKIEATVAARTKKSIKGRVWFVAPPTVILTMENGENQQFTVRADDDVKFAVNGKPATVFDLRKDMDVSAEKIVEEPRVEIKTDTKVVGHSPAPAVAPAAAPAAAPAEAPGAQPPATPETAPVPTESGTNWLLWGGLIVVAAIIGAFLYNRSSAKN